jgi:ribosomal protein S18 acetylase RimI-like enzyme
MLIKNANLEDLNAIEIIGKNSLPIYYNLYNLQLFFYDKNHNILSVFVNDIIIGFIIYEIKLNSYHIKSLAIYLPYRNKGYGEEILYYLKNMLIKYNLKFISLFMQSKNNILKKFYKKNKFINHCIMEKYYTSLDYNDGEELRWYNEKNK